MFLDVFSLSEFRSGLGLAQKIRIRALLKLVCLVVPNCTSVRITNRYRRNMPILLPPQAQRSRVESRPSVKHDTRPLHEYLVPFQFRHLSNPFFHHYPSIRNATVFYLSISSLVILSNTTPLPSATTFTDRKRRRLTLAIPGRLVTPCIISSACRVLINIK